MHKFLTLALSALFVFTLPGFTGVDQAFAADAAADKKSDKKPGKKKEGEEEPDCE